MPYRNGQYDPQDQATRILIKILAGSLALILAFLGWCIAKIYET